MKTWLIIAFLIALTTSPIISCTKAEDESKSLECDNVPKDFTKDVNPIIQTYCNQATCHDAGSTNGPGPLTNYTEVYNVRDRIRGQVEAGLMPQNTTLTTAQKNTIICWIHSGAPEN
jgi:hypothetical protein